MRIILAAAGAVIMSAPVSAAVTSASATTVTDVSVGTTYVTKTIPLADQIRVDNISIIGNQTFQQSRSTSLIVEAYPNESLYGDVHVNLSTSLGSTENYFGRSTYFYDFTLDSDQLFKGDYGVAFFNKNANPTGSFAVTLENLTAGTSQALNGIFSQTLAAGTYRLTAMVEAGFSASTDTGPFDDPSYQFATAFSHVSFRYRFGEGVLNGYGNPNAVPEPATWAFLILGFGLLGSFARYSRTNTGNQAVPIA